MYKDMYLNPFYIDSIICLHYERLRQFLLAFLLFLAFFNSFF